MGFEEWVGGHGVWTLTDPKAPTFASGNSLDKFLLIPGTAVPLAFLPSDAGDSADATGEQSGEIERFYPAVTTDVHIIGNHHAVTLEVPYGDEPAPRSVRVLQ